MDLSTLESWLWDAACALRGPFDAPKFKDYILPLIFLKRLSDVFEDELAHLTALYGDEAVAREVLEGEREQGIIAEGGSTVKFYIPESARWEAIKKHSEKGLGGYLTDAVRAVARENPTLQGVILPKQSLHQFREDKYHEQSAIQKS